VPDASVARAQSSTVPEVSRVHEASNERQATGDGAGPSDAGCHAEPPSADTSTDETGPRPDHA
jgi:hypothetical protein